MSRALLNGCKGKNYDFKTDSRRFKTCLKEAEDHFETNGYHLTIDNLPFLSSQYEFFEEDRPWFLWSPTVDRFRICVFDLHWHWNQFGGWSEGHLGMLGEGTCMYHTALKWLVKFTIRTIEGFWSSIILWHTFSSGLFFGHIFPQTKLIYLSWRNLHFQTFQL